MELFEYIRFRAVPFVVLFVVGVLAIGAVAQVRSGAVRQASTDVLVQPSATQASSFAADPDRYVNTQLSVLRSSTALLEEPARKAGMSTARLASVLTASHGAQTDIATLTVSLPDGDQAIRAADAVATAFVTYLRGETSAAAQRSLQRQIDRVSRQLRDAGLQIQRATRQARASGSAGASTDPFVVAPGAAADQAALNQRLTQLTQQQAQLNSDSAQNPSRVLREADSSTSPLQSNLVTLVAAVVGWLLLLVLAAAVGTTLSKRVLGTARWERLTRGSALGRPFEFGRGLRASSRRARAVQQITAVIDATGDADDAVVVACVPRETARIRRRTVPLTNAIEEYGSRRCSYSTDLGDTLAASTATAPEGDAPVVVLLVDVTRADIGDTDLLMRLDRSRAEKILPVLV